MTRTLQQLIHIGCRDLGIDADTRRHLQLVTTGKERMSDMDEADLTKVLDQLKNRGFKPHKNAGSKRRKHKTAPRADLRYIHVLWGLLGKADKLDRPGRAGLNAFVRSRFAAKWQSVPLDIDSLRDTSQINAVTRALKDWCKREGIPTEKRSD